MGTEKRKGQKPESQSPLNFKSSGKDKHFETQMKIVFEVFKIKPATMLMVTETTGILRANICRYVDKLRKQNKIQEVKKQYCEISKYRAGYYTTDEDLFFNNDAQLSLFEN